MKKLRLFTAILALSLITSLNSFAGARLQVIHNSADMAAQTVDIWLDNTLLLDNFQFRTSSPFIDAPSGTDFTISVKGPDSQLSDDPIWSKDYNLEDDKTYVLIANGIVSAEGYEPIKPFDIYVYDMGREQSSQDSNTDLLVFHGSTDAPIVDVIEVGLGAGTIVNNLDYSSFTSYLELPTNDYVLELTDEEGKISLAKYEAPLKTLDLNGAAAVIVASGFLNPEINSNGESFGLWLALPNGGPMIALPPFVATARVQIIHNSADIAAETVDIWLNGELAIDNFQFRTATPFADVVAEQELYLEIKPSSSTVSDNPLWSNTYTLENGHTYVMIANGIISEANYSPSNNFNVYVYDQGRESAMMSENTDMLVFHGSTDAPTIDIIEAGQKITIVDDLSYGDFDDYLEIETGDYILELQDSSGENTIASFSAPLETLGLENQALVTLASGFYNPANNNDGSSFGLWVALPSGGELLELPAYNPTARVQVIHNSADMAAGTVDVWLNNTLLLDNFMFRTASPFVDAPANQEFTISIKAPDSQNSENPIWSQNYTLEEGETYVLIANGIVSASGYMPMKPFDIYVYAMGREMATNENNTDLLVFHGSTDAPTVDVVEIGQGAGTIIDDMSYSSFNGYLELPTEDYVLDIKDMTGQTSVAKYAAPLKTLGLDGSATIAVASGFLNPENNSDGASFGLWVALPTGGDLIPLPDYNATARVQVIHNSADIAAEVVDVWLNNTLLIDNFEFRTSSPFIDAPADEEFTISIQGPDSQSSENPIWSQNYTLEAGETYVLVANGIVSPEGYDPVKPFDIYVYAQGREMASSTQNTDVLIFHGSTDAPTVDIVEVGVGAGTIVDNLTYGAYADYLELPTDNYQLDIRDETGTITVASYFAPLADLNLQGYSIAVVASGFLAPENNSFGESFGLWVSLPDGGELVELPLAIATSVEDNVFKNTNFNVFPNPATTQFNVQFDLELDSEVDINVYNILGNNVKSIDLGNVTSSTHNETIDVTDLPTGLYIVSIQTGTSTMTQKVHINN